MKPRPVIGAAAGRTSNAETERRAGDRLARLTGRRPLPPDLLRPVHEDVADDDREEVDPVVAGWSTEPFTGDEELVQYGPPPPIRLPRWAAELEWMEANRPVIPPVAAHLRGHTCPDGYQSFLAPFEACPTCGHSPDLPGLRALAARLVAVHGDDALLWVEALNDYVRRGA